GLRRRDGLGCHGGPARRLRCAATIHHGGRGRRTRHRAGTSRTGAVMATTLKSYQLYIDGEWVEAKSDDRLDVINPATEEVIGQVPQASVADVDRAVSAARRAFAEGPWPRLSPRERSDALLRFMQTLA